MFPSRNENVELRNAKFLLEGYDRDEGSERADQKRSRVSSRRRRRQRTSQRSPSIHVRFHAPGVLPIGSWESARQSTNARLTGSGLVPSSRRGHRQR